MSAKESFYGTIALGVAALLILAVGAYWLDARMAFKATALTAVLAYLTQAMTTAQVTIEHQVLTGLIAEPGRFGNSAEDAIEAGRRQVALMFRIAKLLWLLTVTSGTMATMLLIVGR